MLLNLFNNINLLLGPRPKRSKKMESKSSFDSELTNTSSSALRKFRAGLVKE